MYLNVKESVISQSSKYPDVVIFELKGELTNLKTVNIKGINAILNVME